VVVERDGRRVGVLEAGDFFGEMELLEFGATPALIKALTPVRILSLPAGTFTQLLAEHPRIAEGMRALAAERLQTGQTEARIRAVEAGIDTGIIRGNKVLARIPALCPPGCRLCEQACGDRHGAPRIQLNGATFGTFDVPGGCRHCTWSPECVEACPDDAIQLGDNGFLVITDRCNGCGKCAEACPYDAISLLPLYAPVSGPIDWMLRRVRQPQLLGIRGNKCDGCHGYSDRACISICPTGSLRWVSPDELVEVEAQTNAD